MLGRSEAEETMDMRMGVMRGRIRVEPKDELATGATIKLGRRNILRHGLLCIIIH